MAFNGKYIWENYIYIWFYYGDLWEIYDVWKIPSGKTLTICETGSMTHRNSWFTYSRFWFSIVMWKFTRGYSLPRRDDQRFGNLSGKWECGKLKTDTKTQFPSPRSLDLVGINRRVFRVYYWGFTTFWVLWNHWLIACGKSWPMGSPGATFKWRECSPHCVVDHTSAELLDIFKICFWKIGVFLMALAKPSWDCHQLGGVFSTILWKRINSSKQWGYKKTICPPNWPPSQDSPKSSKIIDSANVLGHKPMKYSHHIPLNIHDIPWVLVKCSIYQEISSNPQPPTFPNFWPPKDISPKIPKIPQPREPRRSPKRSTESSISCSVSELRASRMPCCSWPSRTASAPGTRGAEREKWGFFGLNIGETNKKSTKIVCQASINWGNYQEELRHHLTKQHLKGIFSTKSEITSSNVDVAWILTIQTRGVMNKLGSHSSKLDIKLFSVWLLSLPLWKIWKSAGIMKFPIWWESHKIPVMFQTTNQWLLTIINHH